MRQRFKFFLFLLFAPALSSAVAVAGALYIAHTVGSEVRLNDCTGGTGVFTDFVACHIRAYVECLLLLSVTGAIWPVLLALSVSRLCKEARSKRDLRPISFANAVSVAFGSIIAILFVQGTCVSLAIVLIEYIVTEKVTPILALAIWLGTVWVCFQLLQSLKSVKSTPAEKILAVPALSDKQGKLWAFVSDIARQIETATPTNIVLGLAPTFYASAAELELPGNRDKILGKTLYLSLPAMRLLNQPELAAVIGHELAHFRNADTAYVERFRLACHAFNEGMSRILKLNALSLAAALPAITLLSFCRIQFQFVEREMNRAREIEADRIGAGVSSARSLISALAKITISEALWPELDHALATALSRGDAIVNMSETFDSGASRELRAMTVDHLVAQFGKTAQSHPTDTHPCLTERCEALGVTASSALLEVGSSVVASASLVSDLKNLERELSKMYQRQFLAAGRAHLPTAVTRKLDVTAH